MIAGTREKTVEMIDKTNPAVPLFSFFIEVLANTMPMIPMIRAPIDNGPAKKPKHAMTNEIIPKTSAATAIRRSSVFPKVLYHLLLMKVNINKESVYFLKGKHC